MGVSIYSFITPYTFLMGVLWFNAFVLLSLLMRKLKFPIKFSVTPLAVLLVLSLLRMFVVIRIPGSKLVHSEVVFPAIVNFLRFEIIPPLNVLHILIFVWIAVAVILLARYVVQYCKAYQTAMALTYIRDENAELILSEIIDSPKWGRVFRTHVKVPFTAGIKPYIYLPSGVDFTDDELRTILKHEWKHIQNKDYLIKFIMYLICSIFWWNPVVFLLKRNVFFAQELRSDHYAVSDTDYDHYMSGIHRFGEVGKDIPSMGNALVSAKDGVTDRFKILAMRERDKSRGKQVLINVCFFVVAAALLVSSYMFTVQPAFWESPCVEASAECFYSELYEVYRAEENFIIDNGDGTFSLYIDGQHAWDTDDASQEIFTFLPIREREEG